MSIPDLIRKLAAAGAPAEAIAIAVEAMQSAIESIEDRKTYERERKRRQRQIVRDMSGTIEGQSGTPSLETKVPPAPLQKPNPIQPPSPPKGGSSPIASLAFARFWEAYPRKVAKLDAERAFPKALRCAAGPDPLVTILGGLERAKAGWDDPQFIPHPATWLNRGQWTDEPDQPLPSHPNARRPEPKPSDAFARKQANLARAFNASG